MSNDLFVLQKVLELVVRTHVYSTREHFWSTPFFASWRIYQSILWVCMETQGTPRNSKKSQAHPRNPRTFHGIPGNSKERQGTPGNSMEIIERKQAHPDNFHWNPVIPETTRKPQGTPGNPVGHQGIPGNPRELQGNAEVGSSELPVSPVVRSPANLRPRFREIQRERERERDVDRKRGLDNATETTGLRVSVLMVALHMGKCLFLNSRNPTQIWGPSRIGDTT